jgi:hypothetical protein
MISSSKSEKILLVLKDYKKRYSIRNLFRVYSDPLNRKPTMSFHNQVVAKFETEGDASFFSV